MSEKRIEGLPAELTVGFREWKGTATVLPTMGVRHWRLEIPLKSAKDAAEKLRAVGRAPSFPATIGDWVGRVQIVFRAPITHAAIEVDVVEWVEPKPAAAPPAAKRIEVGTRVRVTRDVAHDWEREGPRHLLDGKIGRVLAISSPLGRWADVGIDGTAFAAEFDTSELEPIEASAPEAPPIAEPSEHVKAIVRAAEGLDREVRERRDAYTDCLASLRGWQDKEGTARADAAALRAAIEAATGQAGSTVAELVTGLAEFAGAAERVAARVLEAERREAEARADREHVEAALEQSRRGEEAARSQLSRVAAARDVVREAWSDDDDALVANALEALDRALAGAPDPVRVRVEPGGALSTLSARLDALESGAALCGWPGFKGESTGEAPKRTPREP